MGRKQAASGAGGNFNGERWQEEASVVGPERRGKQQGRSSSSSVDSLLYEYILLKLFVCNKYNTTAEKLSS